jgi:hypothetical protein
MGDRESALPRPVTFKGKPQQPQNALHGISLIGTYAGLDRNLPAFVIVQIQWPSKPETVCSEIGVDRCVPDAMQRGFHDVSFAGIHGSMLPSSVLWSVTAPCLRSYDLPDSTIWGDRRNEEEIGRPPLIYIRELPEVSKRLGDWAWRNPGDLRGRFRGRKKDFLWHAGRQALR